MVWAFRSEVPVFQATSAGIDFAPVDPHKPVAVQLGHDLHHTTVDGVALTGQLGQLLEQHLDTLTGARLSGQRGCG